MKYFKELRQYAIDYAAKNEPRWHYDDSRTETPREANYYSDGEFPGVSIYSKQEDVIAGAVSTISLQVTFGQVVEQGGSEAGFIYISRVCTGRLAGCTSLRAKDHTPSTKASCFGKRR